MKLRCWPGCLAYIVRDDSGQNLGKLVEVVRHVSDGWAWHDYSGEEWECRPVGRIVSFGTRGQAFTSENVVLFGDSLRPITPPPGSETETTGEPIKEVA